MWWIGLLVLGGIILGFILALLYIYYGIKTLFGPEQ